MATESQLLSNNNTPLYPDINGPSGDGQRLTISNRTVTKLSFRLIRVGSPGGTVTFTIRKLTGAGLGTLLVSKLLGNANDISTVATWYEVTFDTPTSINEECRIIAEPSAGTTSNYIAVFNQLSDVKASEYLTLYEGSWVDETAYDCAYIYTHGLPGVTTQATTNISRTTATGNGNIVHIGDSAVTQHGHCWSLLANPTTADSKTQNGNGNVGAFTSSITGLTAGTLYHTRAYATNTDGTSYGADVEFTTLSSFIPKVFIM